MAIALPPTFSRDPSLPFLPKRHLRTLQSRIGIEKEVLR
jgi:hypothetical protein